MSRIGRMPVVIPAGVTVTVAEGNVVTVKGPLGTLTQEFSHILTIKQEGNELLVTRPNDEKETRSLHGLTRALIHNMVEGVTKGYTKSLEIVGVGYKVIKQGKTLQLYLTRWSTVCPRRHLRSPSRRASPLRCRTPTRSS